MSLHLLLPLFAALRRTRRHWHSLCLHLLVFRHNALFSFEHHLRPPLGLRSRRSTFTNNLAKNLHPFVLRRGRVSIEIYDLAIGEADAEALLDKHVALFFFRKGRPASSALRGDLLLRESGLVIDELGGFGEVNRGTRLECRFVISGQFCACQLEEASPPELFSVNERPWTRTIRWSTHRTVTTLLAQISFPSMVLILLIRLRFRLSQPPNRPVHALRHFLILRALRLRHVHHLQFQLADWIRGFALQSGTFLAPRATHRDFFHSPFIEACNVD